MGEIMNLEDYMTAEWTPPTVTELVLEDIGKVVDIDVVYATTGCHGDNDTRDYI